MLLGASDLQILLKTLLIVILVCGSHDNVLVPLPVEISSRLVKLSVAVKSPISEISFIDLLHLGVKAVIPERAVLTLCLIFHIEVDEGGTAAEHLGNFCHQRIGQPVLKPHGIGCMLIERYGFLIPPVAAAGFDLDPIAFLLPGGCAAASQGYGGVGRSVCAAELSVHRTGFIAHLEHRLAFVRFQIIFFIIFQRIAVDLRPGMIRPIFFVALSHRQVHGNHFPVVFLIQSIPVR